MRFTTEVMMVATAEMLKARLKSGTDTRAARHAIRKSTAQMRAASRPLKEYGASRAGRVTSFVLPPVHAAACRAAKSGDAWQLETWAEPLALGQPLPTRPLWLADDFAVPLELEDCYEET